MCSSLGCRAAPGGSVWNLVVSMTSLEREWNGKSSAEGKLVFLSQVEMHKATVEGAQSVSGGN